MVVLVELLLGISITHKEGLIMSIDALTGEDTRKNKPEIKIKFDIGSKTIDIKYDELHFTNLKLFFGFTDNGNLPVKFTNLKFGYDITVETDGVLQYIRSENRGGYIETSEEYAENIDITVKHNTLYTLSVWCYNNGEHFSNSTTITIPEWMNMYPEEYNPPKPGDPRYNMINVKDPWWI